MYWSWNVLLASLTLSVPSAIAPALATGEDAVAAFPIESKAWFNHIGQPISIEGLRGRAVLVEIWATWCPPCREAMPHLGQIQEEFADDGLVVLGLSEEPAATVEPFVMDNDIHLRVAADCKSGPTYLKWAGVNGIPHSFLVDPKGNIMWHGHPMELTEAKIKEALKGARKATGAAALQLNLDMEAPGKQASWWSSPRTDPWPRLCRKPPRSRPTLA